MSTVPIFLTFSFVMISFESLCQIVVVARIFVGSGRVCRLVCRYGRCLNGCLSGVLSSRFVSRSAVWAELIRTVSRRAARGATRNDVCLRFCGCRICGGHTVSERVVVFKLRRFGAIYGFFGFLSLAFFKVTAYFRRAYGNAFCKMVLQNLAGTYAFCKHINRNGMYYDIDYKSRVGEYVA